MQYETARSRHSESDCFMLLSYIIFTGAEHTKCYVSITKEKFIPVLKQTIVSAVLITRLLRAVFPLVDSELCYWKSYARRQLGPTLATQAIQSITKKRFHCLGGSVYSLYPGVNTASFIRFVVALQTISDYLDNLCDRVHVTDELAFSHLHRAMTDALNPSVPLVTDYYRYYPYKEDSGYLTSLVLTCRKELQKLPSYPLVKKDIIKLAGLYSHLQTYKHLSPTVREQKLTQWNSCYSPIYPELTAYEFSAAAGSTLGIFILCAIASKPHLSPDEPPLILTAYFPWICGFHILLDYFIDRQEDLETNDLNFVTYYKNPSEVLERLLLFSNQSNRYAKTLPEPAFTQTIIDGLKALYLSDPKIHSDIEYFIRKKLLESSRLSAKAAYWSCIWLRKKHRL